MQTGSKNTVSSQIPLCKTFIGKEEEEAVISVLRSGWLIHGPYTKKFEQDFADYIGVKHAVAVNSCASALQLSLMASAYNVKKKRGAVPEVILPSFTFVASANAVITAGFKPIFVDIDQNTCNISARAISKAINKNTFAIMPVHFAGQSCRMDEICKIAASRNIVLIEDSAEAIGAEFNGKRTGGFGIGCFSFFPTKNFTTGEGGMLTTNDAGIAERARALIAHGISGATKKKYPWNRNATYAGYNFRMMDLQAAIGIEQLKKLDYMNSKRRELASFFNSKLSSIDELEAQVEDSGCKHVYQMYTPKLNKKIKISRDELVKGLNEKGVGASVHFDPPVHRNYFYRKICKNVKLPVTDSVVKRIFTLPIFPSLTLEEASAIVDTLKDLICKLR